MLLNWCVFLTFDYTNMTTWAVCFYNAETDVYTIQFCVNVDL